MAERLCACGKPLPPKSTNPHCHTDFKYCVECAHERNNAHHLASYYLRIYNVNSLTATHRRPYDPMKFLSMEYVNLRLKKDPPDA